MMPVWHILRKGIRVYVGQAIDLKRVTKSMQTMAEEILKDSTSGDQ